MFVWPRKRIIPALAGNTVLDEGMFLDAADHPRSRGEYHAVSRQVGDDCGSSPLSRGILARAPQPHLTARIIPALAGNSFGVGVCIETSLDHPRSRGEYFSEPLLKDFVRGSSPLSRGIPHHCFTVVGKFGIIPALAGNTQAD